MIKIVQGINIVKGFLQVYGRYFDFNLNEREKKRKIEYIFDFIKKILSIINNFKFKNYFVIF